MAHPRLTGKKPTSTDLGRGAEIGPGHPAARHHPHRPPPYCPAHLPRFTRRYEHLRCHMPPTPQHPVAWRTSRPLGREKDGSAHWSGAPRRRCKSPIPPRLAARPGAKSWSQLMPRTPHTHSHSVCKQASCTTGTRAPIAPPGPAAASSPAARAPPPAPHGGQQRAPSAAVGSPPSAAAAWAPARPSVRQSKPDDSVRELYPGMEY